MLARLFSTAVFASTLLACSSLPDLSFDGDGGPVVDGSGVDGGVDASCTRGAAEICDDGVDNDCDGKIDCADSDCNAGFSCQAAPADWALIAFSASAQPACPAGAAQTDLKVSDGDGAAACSCSCSGVGGACTGNVTVVATNEATCGVSPGMGSVPQGAGGCTALAANVPVPAGAFAKVVQPVGPTSCAVVSAAKGPIATGRACQAARYGGGCGGGQICAPKPTTGLESCVAKAGKNVCPTGFPARHTVGTTANDQRTCTGCACGVPTPCAGATVSLYDAATCKTVGQNHGAVDIGSTCATTSDSSFTATHFRSTSVTGGGCGLPTAQAVPGGTLSFTDERTVCCK